MRSFKFRSIVAGLTIALLAVTAGPAAWGATLTWDANGATANQTDGAGAWLGAMRTFEVFLAAAMKFMQGGSHWLYGIGQVDASFLANQLTAREALDLFQEILREPQPLDWAVDPMESLAVMITPHPQAMEHWFSAALQRTGVVELTGNAVLRHAGEHREARGSEDGDVRPPVHPVPEPQDPHDRGQDRHAGQDHARQTNQPGGSVDLDSEYRALLNLAPTSRR